MTTEAVLKALEAAIREGCDAHCADPDDLCTWPDCYCTQKPRSIPAAVAAFLRALPEREKAAWEYDPVTRKRVPTNMTIPAMIMPHKLADIVDAAAKERP
jgi:hypothetical protein